MINDLMRKNHRVLMIVITVLVGLSFCIYWTKTDWSAMGPDRVGKIYGRTVSSTEYQRGARLAQLGYQLGLTSLMQDLGGNAATDKEFFDSFVWNRIVLRHEADRYGIRPTSEEVVKVVKMMRPFRGENGFDPAKYSEFTQRNAPALGMTEAQIEELASDELRANQLKRLLGVGVQISDTETRTSYEQLYGKVNALVLRFRSEDFANEVKITDDDIAKYFEGHKAQLKSDEKRRVSFVAFSLNDEQKKLAGKERIDVMQKLSDRAGEFTQAMLEKGSDFATVAGKFEVPLHETGDFTEAKPDAQLAGNPDVARAAFTLTQADPNSDAIQGTDGFYVLRLTGVTEARPLTLDEAKPKIVEALKTDRLNEIVSAKAAAAKSAIHAAVAAGKPIANAVAETGMKPEAIPAFSLSELPGRAPEKKDPKTEPPDLPQIKQAAAELNPGDVSDFVLTQAGGLLVAIEKREPIDPQEYETGKMFVTSSYLRNKREAVFQEWLRERRNAAGLQPTDGPRRAARG